jgi:tripeptidyl-peptidase-1
VEGPQLAGGPLTLQSVAAQTLGAVGRGNAHWLWTEIDWVVGLGQTLASMTDEELPSVLTITQAVPESMQCAVDPLSPPCIDAPDEPASSAAYIQTANTLLAAATARGVTIFASAGDSGAHAASDTGCAQPFMPSFPATSPWVTAVGATKLVNVQQVGAPRTPLCQQAALASSPTSPRCAAAGDERVLSSGDGTSGVTSGGGFSWHAARPAWQDAAVSAYLASGVQLPDAAAYNADGRAIPDVSALGAGFPAWADGLPVVADATGAATAVWGGIAALANAARAARGLPRLGFLNPVLYELASTAGTASVFRDVVAGNNACNRAPCADTCTPDRGFDAAPGWDPASGLGTPNVFAFMQAVVPGFTMPVEPAISAAPSMALVPAAALTAAVLAFVSAVV